MTMILQTISVPKIRIETINSVFLMLESDYALLHGLTLKFVTCNVDNNEEDFFL